MLVPFCMPVTFREAVADLRISDEERLAARYPATSVVANSVLSRMREGESGDRYASGLYSLKRNWWDRPSRTILATTRVSRGSLECCHPSEDRRLTDREIARVCSFPDSFRLPVPEGRRLAGNAVPPLMMRRIAIHVRRALDGKE